MKTIIRLTESDLHKIIKEAVNKILSEDGPTAAGGGTLGDSNLINGTSDASGGITYSAFGGGKGKKKGVGGNPFNEPIMRQGNNLGDRTSEKVNQDATTQDFIKPALERKKGASIAMNRQK